MDKDQHDMLIRIDERTIAIDKEVTAIKKWSQGLPCQTQTEKIKTLEKITWGAALAAIVAMTKSFWGNLTG